MGVSAMPINEKLVKWDDAPATNTIDPRMVKWDDDHSTIGNILTGALNGAASIGTTLLRPLDATGLTGITNIDRKASIKQFMNENANTDSLAFKGGDITAQLAGTAGVGGVFAKGASLIPALAKYAPVIESGGFNLGGAATKSILANTAIRAGSGALTNGVAGGLLDPSSAIQSAGIGAVLPSGVKLAGKMGGMIMPDLLPTAEKLDLIKQSNNLGIPVGLSKGYDSGFMGGLRSVMNDLPLIGKIGANANDAAQQGLNKAVGNTFGAPSTSLTPEVMLQAKQRMGDEFNRIWGNNNLKLNPDFLKNLDELKANAAMSPDGGRVNKLIDDFLSKRQDTGSGSIISGDVANRFQSKINDLSGSATGFIKQDLQSLRKNILSEFNNNISSADAKALSSNRFAYKNYKTVEPLLNSAEAAVSGRVSGDVPISLLPNAVYKNFSNPAGLPLTNISQVAGRLLTDRVKQTGGSARAYIQNSAIGTGGMMGLLHNPVAGLATIAGLSGLQKLINSPKIANMAANVPQLPQGLLDDLLPLLNKATPVLSNRAQ